MKRVSGGTMRIAGIIGTAVLLIAGCGTTGRKSTSQTSAAVSNLESRVELAKAQVDAVVLGLQGLQGKQGKDLEKQYGIFKREVDQIKKMARSFQSQIEAMKKQGEAHFSAWEKNMAALDDEELREMSAARRTQLKMKYGALAESLRKVGNAYQQFIGGLDAVVTYLDLDLTPASVNMLGGRTTQVEASAEQLKAGFDAVGQELAKLAAEMST